MYSIKGTHSIKSAAKNLKRSNIVFSGQKHLYHQLQLNCKLVESNRNTLLTKELFIAASFDEIIQSSKIILMDELDNIGNIASIIRSAAILGYSVILKKCAHINEKVLEMSCGGVDNTSIFLLNSNIVNTIRLLQKKFTFYGLSEKETPFNNTISNKFILIVGSEEKGISRLLETYINYFVKLRGKTTFNTFNASVAASIAMYIL